MSETESNSLTLVDRIAAAIKNTPGDREKAIAAIQAMREPTKAMQTAPQLLWSADLITRGYEWDEHDSDPDELSPQAPALIWRSMIDAALEGVESEVATTSTSAHGFEPPKG